MPVGPPNEPNPQEATMSVAKSRTHVLVIGAILITGICQAGATVRTIKECDTDLEVARTFAGRVTTASISVTRSVLREIVERLPSGTLPSATPAASERRQDEERPTN
jgi:hypothetical protein